VDKETTGVDVCGGSKRGCHVTSLAHNGMKKGYLVHAQIMTTFSIIWAYFHAFPWIQNE